MIRQASILEPRGCAINTGGALSRNSIAFFIFGLVNNIVYVIFLSAASDISKVDPNIKKSSILLASIVPCLFVKIVSPHFVQVIPYTAMVSTCILFSFSALVLVGGYDVISIKFGGIVLASLSSGLGETAFLALTSRYDPGVVVSWSSGTGAAGIIGAVYYWTARSVLDLSLLTTMLMACILPLLMGLSYSVLLCSRTRQRTLIEQESPVSSPKADPADELTVPFADRLRLIRPLLLRYIVPLFLVYYVEYTINSSVYFALYYPLENTPFRTNEDHYRTYSALYQVGVFLSRTFGRRIAPVRNGWVFVIFQALIFVILSGEVIFSVINQVFIVFGLILIEGLLGGAAYVNTYCNISEQVERRHLEFSMAVTGVADSSGIALAALTSLFYEPFLCNHNGICRTLGKHP